MKLLAVDSATEACSAALSIDGRISERWILEPRAHARRLLSMVDSLCREADIRIAQLDALAFGRGPGSFTGLRIASSLAQGVAFGADIPVVPVSTLATIAQSAVAEDVDGVMVAIDARMQEVYWCGFRRGEQRMEAMGEELVCSPEAVPIPAAGQWLGLGTGWAAYADGLVSRAGPLLSAMDDQRLPRASDMLALAATDYLAGKALPAEQAQPVYLRNQVV